MMHKAVRPSNYFFKSFTYYQAEQIKKEVISVQILLLNAVDFIFKVGKLFIHLSWSDPASTRRENDVDAT